MTGASRSLRWSPRVYYRSFFAGLALLTLLGLAAAPAPAQVELTVHPSMVKGPAGAPVTIIEFSDYQ